MKIFFSGIYQETNSFCPAMTDLECFQRGYLLQGDAIREQLYGTNTEIGGFFEALENHPEPIEMIPGMAAWAVAYGPVLKATFAQLAAMIIEPLKNSWPGPVDGVFLSLHGSLVAEHLDDCEGTLRLDTLHTNVGRIQVYCQSLRFHLCIRSVSAFYFPVFFMQ